MKNRKFPVIVGGIVSMYCLVSLCVAFLHALRPSKTELPWWDVWIIRAPGYWFGERVVAAMKSMKGMDYSFLVAYDIPWFIFIMALIAVGLGALCWFLFSLLVRLLSVKKTFIGDDE